MKNMKKKGINLIILTVTIAVMIILAGVVILSLKRDDTITFAKESRFYSEIEELNSSLRQSAAALQIKNSNVNPENINAKSLADIKKYIPKFPDKYEGVLEIYKGEIVYVGNNVNERKWAESMGILKTQIDNKVSEKFTIIKTESTYDRPYIPNGFRYVKGEYNTGFIISDYPYDVFEPNELYHYGNQYVWIPVDRKTLNFQLYYTDNPLEYVEGEGFDEAAESIKKYGGFYLGRFELTNSPTEPKVFINQMPITMQSYTTFEKAAKKISLNVSDYKCVIPYGTMWETAVKWLENTGAIPHTAAVGPAGNYGTYGIYPITVTGKKQYNNIGELGGNVKEWTQESAANDTNKKVTRGGYMTLSKTSTEASFTNRMYSTKDTCCDTLGGRFALYIK